MNNNFIFSKKNTSDMGKKQIERNFENIFFQEQEKKKNSDSANNIHYLDRPNYNNYERNNSKINNFYNYTIPQKASLGYNVLFEKQQENLLNKKINNENNIENNLDLFKFNNSLPNNIYHNFSENTRYTRKKNTSTNFNINDRNNEEKMEKTQYSAPFYNYSSTR